MLRIYVDYENVHSEGLADAGTLAAGDTLNVFYSNKCESMNMDAVKNLMESKATVRFYKVPVGCKDALDNQLLSAVLVDRCTSENAKDDSFVIISEDKGYDKALNFCKKEKSISNIRRFPSITSMKNTAKENPVDVNMRGYIKKFLDTALDESETDLLIKGVKESEDKMALYHFCTEKMHENGLDFYTLVKGHFLNLKKIAA